MAKNSYQFHKDHAANLPTIRIASIELNNFKSVKHGKIMFNCGKNFVPYGTTADILGIYGQNGSGKTSVIEAISILKCLISGSTIPDTYSDCIDVASPFAELTFTFDVQYPEGSDYETNNDVRKVVYSFKLTREEKNEIEIPQVFTDDSLNDFLPISDYRLVVFDETIKISGTICGEKVPLKPYIDTSNEKNNFGPSTKMKLLFGEMSDEKKIEIEINRRLAKEKSRSFVFMPSMIAIYSKNSNYSFLYQMLIELRLWGKDYLFVVDSKTTGMVRLNTFLPIYIGKEMTAVPINRPFVIEDKSYEEMVSSFDLLSNVLSEIVPGLTIGIKDYGSELSEDGKHGRRVELIARRGNVEIPLRAESDGVRKLISTLNFLVSVHNQKSTTVAYDEFDSGVFEYLLGEILQVIQISGKGQFIFTSHNMRPLEVLKKDFVCFTTTDPLNRYIKMTGIGESNNLRRVYYREIAMHEHYTNLYNETKRNKIESAMRKIGGI